MKKFYIIKKEPYNGKVSGGDNHTYSSQRQAEKQAEKHAANAQNGGTYIIFEAVSLVRPVRQTETIQLTDEEIEQ
jgi:hypothetical protein